jgi:DnaJ-class molecular chaperone
MLRIGLSIAKFSLTRAEACLGVLKLNPPTTKKEIKTRYLELAKQLHPDVTDEASTNSK